MYGVIDRLVADYGVGYFKLEYNIEGLQSAVFDESVGEEPRRLRIRAQSHIPQVGP
ncbi:unnamed protein product [Penicillium camemberti]|uniref:Str. FM013 n=1 Tax=Penicillium camemberti (strain FM 013) TaxID=1429867 RepID=A0A0G4NX51_PENC3|nr:unnamed protein product [Penicillium camemberti]